MWLKLHPKQHVFFRCEKHVNRQIHKSEFVASRNSSKILGELHSKVMQSAMFLARMYEKQASRVYLLFGDDTDKIGVSGAQIGSGRPKRVQSQRLIFSAFKQPQCRVQMAALTPPLPTEATIEEKTNTFTDRRNSTCHRRPQKLFQKILTHSTRQSAMGRQENLEW